MPGITNAELATALQAVIAQVDAREDQLLAWQAGTATGGPYADGRYPIVNLLGELGYYKSPARLAHEVGLLTTSATGTLASCLAAQAAAEAASASSDTRATASANSAATATTKAAEADTFRQQAANSEANALVHRNAASASAATAATAATTATTARDVTTAARDVAITARNDAQAAAAAAATFDPANFYTKTAADGRYLQITNFTWTNLSGKPSTFAPSAHTHVIADVTGLQTALDGKQASGSYVTTAGFTWADLAGKPSTFTPSAHSHVISDVTGLQTALDAKLALAGGTMTGNLTTSGNILTTAGEVTAQHNGTAITSLGIVRPGVDAMIQLARTGSTVGTLPINNVANTTYIYTTGGLLRIGGSGNFVTLDNGGATFSSTVTLNGAVAANSTLTVTSGNLRVKSGGGDSAMGAYVGFRNSSDVERGWVGYGDSTSRMRVYNGIGDILIQGNKAIIDSSASATNVRISTTSGYLDVGPLNTGWCHYNTDRAAHYFGQPVHVDGALYRYGEGAVLHHGSSSLGSGRITVSTSSASGGSDGDIWIKVAS